MRLPCPGRRPVAPAKAAKRYPVCPRCRSAIPFCPRRAHSPLFTHLTVSSVSPFISFVYLHSRRSLTTTNKDDDDEQYCLLHSCGVGKLLSLSLLCAPVRVLRLFGRPSPPLTSARAAKLHIRIAVRKADPLRLLIPRHCCLSHTTAQQSQPVFLRLWTSISSSRFSIHPKLWLLHYKTALALTGQHDSAIDHD